MQPVQLSPLVWRCCCASLQDNVTAGCEMDTAFCVQPLTDDPWILQLLMKETWYLEKSDNVMERTGL